MRRVSGRRVFVAALVAGLALVPALANGAHHHFSVKIGSVNSAGVKGNDNSSTEGTQELSQNGRLYVFTSQATNLRHGDGTNYQAYLHDFKTGKTKLISTSSAGVAAGGYVNYPEISANGRIVTFDGPATGLPGSGADAEVWAKDLKTGKTVLVSKTNQGDPASGGSSSLATPSADGRFVAFESMADNLPGGDGTNRYVYVRDLKKGKTILASRDSAGDPVTGHPYGQSLSGNGRSIVFSSDDAALPNGGDSFDHVYIRNLANGNDQAGRRPQ